VQLQAVQELWEMLSVDLDDKCSDEHSDTNAQVLMVLSQEAVSVGSSPMTHVSGQYTRAVSCDTG
jgi:hypothetical protein